MNHIYMDYNATAPMRAEASAVMADVAERCYANASSTHGPGREARRCLDDARTRLADLLGVSAREVLFTAGGTEGDNIAIQGIAGGRSSGHVITSSIEHPAVLETCRALEARGIDVTYLDVDAAGVVDPDVFGSAFRDDTFLASIMWVNNETGVIQPIPELAALARERFGVPEVSMFAGLASDHLRLLRERRADLAVTSDALFEIEALSRYPILRERYLLVTPKGFAGPLDDPQALARSLPFIRFTGETGVGRRIDQHLNRLRLDLPRTLEGDRASIVLAPIAEGMGFSFLTPTLLIDGVAEGMEVDVHPLPVPGVSRDVMLVARERELDRRNLQFDAAHATWQSEREQYQQRIQRLLSELRDLEYAGA